MLAFESADLGVEGFKSTGEFDSHRVGVVDRLAQFLIEAVVLSVIGGLVGILLGAGIARAVNTLDVITTVISPQAVALAVSFSVAVGLFFGIYPAWRAAQLNPIEALRYE